MGVGDVDDEFPGIQMLLCSSSGTRFGRSKSYEIHRVSEHHSQAVPF
jgi:hypothetical protein